MKLEDLRIGADVVSSEGHKLGKLSKFVVREGEHRLTHVVVDTGILRSGEPLWKGGWGLSHDRVIPLLAVEHATSDTVTLTMAADDFRDHSVDYEEEYFEAMPDIQRGAVDVGDVARFASSIPGEPGPWIMLDRRALAPGDVEIPRDAPVWRLKPHEKVGEVERVLISDGGEIEGIVIKRGFIFTKEVVLPVHAIVEIVAGIVRVDLDEDALKGLPEFRAPD